MHISSFHFNTVRFRTLHQYKYLVIQWFVFVVQVKDTVLLVIAGLGEISWRNYAFNRNSSHSRGKKAVGFSSSFPAGEGTAARFSLSQIAFILKFFILKTVDKFSTSRHKNLHHSHVKIIFEIFWKSLEHEWNESLFSLCWCCRS